LKNFGKFPPDFFPENFPENSIIFPEKFRQNFSEHCPEEENYQKVEKRFKNCNNSKQFYMANVILLPHNMDSA